MSIKREYGKEQPYISAGPFKIRLPILHLKFEKVDYFQGLLLCAVCLGAIPMLQEYLGMPFDVAMTIVVLNGALYLLHIFLGDPIIPGWITPAIPIVMLYLSQYPIGTERVHALIALQFSLGIFAMFLGITGLGEKVTNFVPAAMKSGVILGAGIAAINSTLKAGGYFEKYPISIVICVGLGFYFLFSSHFKSKKDLNKFTKLIFNLGSLPIIIMAIVLGPLLGETDLPNIEWGITSLAFRELITDWTIFGLGLPPLRMYINGIPIIISCYIILFGDMIQAQSLLEDASKKRPDEIIDYNPNRSHLIFGLRNILKSILGPDLTLSGPLAAAMQIVLCERYKNGRKTMDSIHGGAISYRYGTLSGYFILPVVTLIKPILGIALAATMLLQGYVSFRVGVMKARTYNDLSIAGVMAVIIAIKGAAWGLLAGIILSIFINYKRDKELESLLFEKSSFIDKIEKKETNNSLFIKEITREKSS